VPQFRLSSICRSLQGKGGAGDQAQEKKKSHQLVFFVGGKRAGSQFLQRRVCHCRDPYTLPVFEQAGGVFTEKHESGEHSSMLKKSRSSCG